MSFVDLGVSQGTLVSSAGDDVIVKPRSLSLAFLAVLACGCMNNFSYCIISGASQQLAKQFHAESQVTALTTTMTFAALMATLISTKLLLRFRFKTRIRLVLVMTTLAYFGVAMAAMRSDPTGFILAGAFSVLGSMAQIFGEVTNLAFLKSFPPELIGGWGAGTGVAGIMGSLVYMLLHGPVGLNNTWIFICVMPTLLVYTLSFQYLHHEAVRSVDDCQLHAVLGGYRANSTTPASESFRRELEAPLHGTFTKANPLPATWKNICEAVHYSGGIMFNLVAVYCLEYFIYPGLDDRETICSGGGWYTAMWMCYNIGVTASRFSVALFRIQRVWILTAFQLLNVIGWTAEVCTGAIRNSLPNEFGLYFSCAWMVLVGLCGGATYANCMYLFNRKTDIPDNLRELGINLGFVMSNIGITLATFSFSILDSTMLTKSVLYPNGCGGAAAGGLHSPGCRLCFCADRGIAPPNF